VRSLAAGVTRKNPPRVGRMSLVVAIVLVFVVLGLIWTGSAWATTYDNGYAPYAFPASFEHPYWEYFTVCGVSGSGDSSADYIVGIQRELGYLGFYFGTNDGLFGSGTEDAVDSFLKRPGFDGGSISGIL
jgi:hypothetical protein